VVTFESTGTAEDIDEKAAAWEKTSAQEAFPF
jgi:hypothetical protein